MRSCLLANSRQGINEVLRYAGKAWVFERDLASAEDISGYWENAAPIWRVRRHAKSS